MTGLSGKLTLEFGTLPERKIQRPPGLGGWTKCPPGPCQRNTTDLANSRPWVGVIQHGRRTPCGNSLPFIPQTGTGEKDGLLTVVQDYWAGEPREAGYLQASVRSRCLAATQRERTGNLEPDRLGQAQRPEPRSLPARGAQPDRQSPHERRRGTAALEPRRRARLHHRAASGSLILNH